jgi:hypothetical protein
MTELSFHGIATFPMQLHGKVLPMCPVRNVTHVSGRSGPPFRGLARRICARLSKDRDPVVFSEAMGKAFRRLSGTGRAEVKPLGYGG